MGEKRKPGRPRMPENLKKKGISVKVKPELFKAIEEQTRGKNRNQELESVLGEKFLTSHP